MIGTSGVHSLNIVGIAERVGIVPSALYRHFDSKDDVLDGVLDLLKNRLLGNLRAVRKEGPDALCRLKSLLEKHARLLSENRAIPYVVFSDGIYTGHPDRKGKVGEIMTHYLEGIERIIEEGIQEGTIRGDVVPFSAAMMFLGMILPAAVFWNLTDGRIDIVEHTESVWPVFARTIAADQE